MPTNRDQFYSWLGTQLKDKGWQFSQSGRNISASNLNPNQQIEPATGFWSNPNYATSKPPRWIIQFDSTFSPVTAIVPTNHRANRIGYSNTAQGDKVGIAVRIIPAIKKTDGTFFHHLPWEWGLTFLFPYPVPVGSSAETFDYDHASGIVSYAKAATPTPYIFAGLLGITDPSDAVTVDGKPITYGEATTALKGLLHSCPLNSTISNIDLYDLTRDVELARLKREVSLALDTAPAPPVASPVEASPDDENDGDNADENDDATFVEIEENKDLLGIDPAVYRQINAALRSGKQHLMFYGPPGTGKTTLARWVATKLRGTRWTLITGSADWSSQDVIGGYQPVGDGKIRFLPGVLLKAFDQPLIIDELNRCDIDKVIGPLFTVLSGHHTSLPYRINVEDPNSPSYVILPTPKSPREEHEFAPGRHWRLIATINSIDKASLYQMSYALSRRFGWIYVDAPQDKVAFVRAYLENIKGIAVPAEATEFPIAAVWDSVNKVRVLGSAPFNDAINAILAMDDAAILHGPPTDKMKGQILDAFDMFVLPLVDGILRHEAESLLTELAAHLNLADGDSQQAGLRRRLLGVSV